MNDRHLGMHAKISRRDFLDGVAVTAVGALSAGVLPACSPHNATPIAMAGSPGRSAYPPATTGLWGQDNSSFAVMHKIRDGTFWQGTAAPQASGEHYDLVVVGAGMSGLASAYFYRQQRPNARILIVDVRLDFGGHAGRNEFRVGDRFLLSNAGTQSMESPSHYRPSAARLVRELGIDVNRFFKYFDTNRYAGLSTGLFFNQRTFGRNHFVAGAYKRPWTDVLRDVPLATRAKADLIRIHTEMVDYLPNLSVDQKTAYLKTISYSTFITKHARCDPGVLPYLQDRSYDLFGTGIEVVAAYDCFESGDDYGMDYPGFQGMDLGLGVGKWRRAKPDPYIFHFPDGNASIARMLVRSLVPGAIAGSTMEDIVLAPCDYSTLDRPSNQVRIRLNATTVKVAHRGDPARARSVEVTYTSDNHLATVTADACILACWHVVSRLIAPELPAQQKEHLAYCVKEPFVYTHVALTNWRSFQKLGVYQILAPTSYHYFTMLDYPVDMGGYHSSKTPDDPIVLFMLRAPTQYGLPPKEQYRAGRWQLFGTPFVTIERKIRQQLGDMLGNAGFDPARDIAGITVNRWSHGYAYEYNKSLWEHWPAGQRPCDLAKQPFHRIAIANSDSSGEAFTDTAIDEGYRAVGELLQTG
ncbi:MAG: NAD(P)/FAD-dependent oxidoreductase [Candidatus Eremiobacteraeota bacterium]|nr:NAD(P)/FAD-dependent oxidoreductase [Candidatus Eremiobacteraeota bacterium]